MFIPKSLVAIAILLVSGLNFCYSKRDGSIFESCIKRRTCQSNNDPHMVSFSNYHFEFQVDGSHCMAYSDLYQVQSEFEQCGSATCNCMVEVILPNGDYARINNCGNSSKPIDTVQTSSGQVTCDSVTIPLFNPFLESHWNLVSSGNSNFQCVQFHYYTYIKTVLPNPDDNVIVQISGEMNSVNVIVPPSYTPIRGCLCDDAFIVKRDVSSAENVKHISQEEIKSFKNFEKCESILKPEKLRDVIAKADNAELNARLDNFVQNCAIDAEFIRGIELGKFQKADAGADICQVLLNQPVEQAAEFLRILRSDDDSDKRIQRGTCSVLENGFEICIKMIKKLLEWEHAFE